jgi:hypothetical protein
VSESSSNGLVGKVPDASVESCLKLWHLLTLCLVFFPSPSSQSEKLLGILFLPLAVAAMGQWLGVIANFIVEGRSAKFRSKVHQREMTMKDLEVMDLDGNGAVTRTEFIKFMLLAMNKIDIELVKELHAHFDRWNESRSGELCRQDLVEAARRKLRSPKYKLQLASYKDKIMTQAARGSRRKSFWRQVLSQSSTLKKG